MNAGFVSKRIASDDRLVRLDRNAGNLTEHLARGVKVFADNAGGIFGREFHVLTRRLGQTDSIARLLQALLARNFQLVLQMNVGGRQKDMNAGMGCALERLPSALDILRTGTGEASNNRSPDDCGDGLNGGGVAVRGRP